MAGEADNYRYGHMLSAMAVKSYGPEFQDKLAAREFNYDSPEVVSLIQEIKDMQDKGYFGENILSVDVPAERTYFGAGDCAFMIDLSRAGAILKDSECFKAKKLHTAKFPYFDEQYATSNMGGASQNYFVCTLNKSVNQIKASLKVLKWLIQTALTVPTWQHPERSKYLLDRIALNRPGYPSDIVGVCILLASEASSYITGAEIRVDGGCIAGGQPWPYDTEF